MLHPDEQFSKLGSVGRECVGSRPIRLLDSNGIDVPDGEPGELFSCNSYTFDGYWKLPDKTKEAFRGDYCTVGDLARRDPQYMRELATHHVGGHLKIAPEHTDPSVLALMKKAGCWEISFGPR